MLEVLLGIGAVYSMYQVYKLVKETPTGEVEGRDKGRKNG